jgi:hypothetical protein
MFPNIMRSKLNRKVLAVWDSSSKTETNVYLSEVLGKFGAKHCAAVINPQLVE